MLSTSNPLTFQELILRLQIFWAENGCVLQQPYDVEVGAGTMAPETFLRVLGPRPYRVGYVQPSRRPADGRYGENPNRLFKHMQYQVILKPPPADVQELYLKSLAAIGIDLRKHDIKFEEDNWESPTLGAWGIGWQVMLDGLEITQFTYFQQCGGIDLDPISAELTYGLERIAAFLQDVDSIYDITWVVDPDGRAVKYGEIRLQDELQFSVYNFEAADVERTWRLLDSYEDECLHLLRVHFEGRSTPDQIRIEHSQFTIFDDGRFKTIGAAKKVFDQLSPEVNPFSFYPFFDRTSGRVEYLQGEVTPGDPKHPYGVSLGGPIRIWRGQPGFESGTELSVTNPAPLVIAAYDLCLKCSHLFNILDARGAISVTERVGVIARIRALAVGVAKAYVDQQKAASENSPLSEADETRKTGAPREPEQLAAGR